MPALVYAGVSGGVFLMLWDGMRRREAATVELSGTIRHIERQRGVLRQVTPSTAL
jgi:hypothetical protein